MPNFLALALLLLTRPAPNVDGTQSKITNGGGCHIAKYLNLTWYTVLNKYILSSYIDKYILLKIWKVRFEFRVLQVLGILQY